MDCCVHNEKKQRSKASVFSVPFLYCKIVHYFHNNNTVWPFFSPVILFGDISIYWFFNDIWLQRWPLPRPFCVYFILEGKGKRARVVFCGLFGYWRTWYSLNVTTCRRRIWGRSWSQSWGQGWGQGRSTRLFLQQRCLFLPLFLFFSFFFFWLLFWSAAVDASSTKLRQLS